MKNLFAFILKIPDRIRRLLWVLIAAYMIAWHNFYNPVEKYLLQGNSRITIEILEEEEDSGKRGNTT